MEKKTKKTAVSSKKKTSGTKVISSTKANSNTSCSSNSEDIIQNKNKDIPGRFQKGNTIGYETRFQPGHTLSTKYQDEYADQLLEFFTDPDVEFPTIEGFAKKYHIAIRTVYDWIEAPEKYPQFALSHAQAMAIQRDKLLVGGLTEQYNSQIVKFIAVNCHGMKEKIEQEVKGDATINVNISFFDEENKRV